jgi:hypothetical protein
VPCNACAKVGCENERHYLSLAQRDLWKSLQPAFVDKQIAIPTLFAAKELAVQDLSHPKPSAAGILNAASCVLLLQ